MIILIYEICVMHYLSCFIESRSGVPGNNTPHRRTHQAIDSLNILKAGYLDINVFQ